MDHAADNQTLAETALRVDPGQKAFHPRRPARPGSAGLAIRSLEKNPRPGRRRPLKGCRARRSVFRRHADRSFWTQLPRGQDQLPRPARPLLADVLVWPIPFGRRPGHPGRREPRLAGDAPASSRFLERARVRFPARQGIKQRGVIASHRPGSLHCSVKEIDTANFSGCYSRIESLQTFYAHH